MGAEKEEIKQRHTKHPKHMTDRRSYINECRGKINPIYPHHNRDGVGDEILTSDVENPKHGTLHEIQRNRDDNQGCLSRLSKRLHRGAANQVESFKQGCIKLVDSIPEIAEGAQDFAESYL